MDVYHITKFNVLLKIINELFKKGLHVSVCPYYDIQNEYRAVIYKNKLQILFDKKRKSSWKHNLANGSIPINITNKQLKKQISDLAIKATSLLNIKFVSVDIVKINNELKILEINSGVMLEKFSSISKSNYKQVKQLYKKVILDL
jgi:glutathione synthase/RimK-type ligase-like ATP-grasp enzyme